MQYLSLSSRPANKLAEGDSLDVVLTDGTVISYAVTAAWSYPVQELQMSEILAQTSLESLTLITCGVLRFFSTTYSR